MFTTGPQFSGVSAKDRGRALWPALASSREAKYQFEEAKYLVTEDFSLKTAPIIFQSWAWPYGAPGL